MLQLSDSVLDGLRSLLYCLPSKSVKNIIFIITQINVSAGELFSLTGFFFSILCSLQNLFAAVCPENLCFGEGGGWLRPLDV